MARGGILSQLPWVRECLSRKVFSVDAGVVNVWRGPLRYSSSTSHIKHCPAAVAADDIILNLH